MRRIGAFLLQELLEALPAALFFLVLFHLVALTKAVARADYSLTALRAAGTTVAALVVAKAMLVVEALPLARRTGRRVIAQVFWKSLLVWVLALCFQFMEEVLSLLSKHESLAAAFGAVGTDIRWPMFWVFGLWLFGGLLLFCFASELLVLLGTKGITDVLRRRHRDE